MSLCMRRTGAALLLFSWYAWPGFSSDRQIHITGDALVESKPDYAVVRLNLEARDRLLKRARAAHEADIASVLEVAAKYKVAGADIAQDFPEIESRGDGYFLRRTVQLTVRDLKSYDTMLFDLYDSAAVTVESVEFRVTDLRKLRDRAREMAIRAASDKVQQAAVAMNRRVGRVMDVRVETGAGRCCGGGARPFPTTAPGCRWRRTCPSKQATWAAFPALGRSYFAFRSRRKWR
jgi:uncharacterized protein YggE